MEDLTMEFSNQIVDRMRRGRKEMTGLPKRLYSLF